MAGYHGYRMRRFLPMTERSQNAFVKIAATISSAVTEYTLSHGLSTFLFYTFLWFLYDSATGSIRQLLICQFKPDHSLAYRITVPLSQRLTLRHALFPLRPTAVTWRLRSSTNLPKVHTRTHRYVLSYNRP